MNFCIKKYIGTQGEVCRQLKYFTQTPPAPTPVVYATDRSKAVIPVVPVWFLFCVALWFILRGASCFPVHFVLVFLHSFLYCDQLAWGRRNWSVCFLCIFFFFFFVLYVLVFVIFLFLLVSGVGCGLWLWYSLDFSINFFISYWHISILDRFHSQICNMSSLLERERFLTVFDNCQFQYVWSILMIFLSTYCFTQMYN